MRDRRVFTLLGLLVVTSAVLVAPLAMAAPPEGTRPPGNNGTVKVDDAPFDDHPNNEPHVGCVFQLDLYGYDLGDLSATYTLELWSPTGSGVVDEGSTEIGEDSAGGGTDLDASVTVDLTAALARSSATPHPKQGYHVRLTVHAEGSIGADVKHKMLWVTCASRSNAPTSAPPTTTPPSESVSPSESTSTSESASPSESGSPSESTSSSESTSTSRSPTPTTSVLSSSGTPSKPGGPTTSPSRPGETAFTGLSAWWAAVTALLLLLAGAAFLRGASRRIE
jgi:hypothetical protein